MSEQHHEDRSSREPASGLLSLLALVLALSFAASTVACNAVKGLGRDVESVGEAGSDAIDDD